MADNLRAEIQALVNRHSGRSAHLSSTTVHGATLVAIKLCAGCGGTTPWPCATVKELRIILDRTAPSEDEREARAGAYVPTTEEIREYVANGGEYRPWEAPSAESEEKRRAAFDRWLASERQSWRIDPTDEALVKRLCRVHGGWSDDAPVLNLDLARMRRVLADLARTNMKEEG